jgi:hypothetical protein
MSSVEIDRILLTGVDVEALGMPPDGRVVQREVARLLGNPVQRSAEAELRSHPTLSHIAAVVANAIAQRAGIPWLRGDL